MAYGPIKLLDSFTLPATNGSALYQQPSGKMVEIASIIFHNSGSTAQTVQFWVTQAAATGRLLSISLAANDTFEFSPKVPVVLNWSSVVGQRGVWATATTATTVNMHLYGREEV